MKTTVCNNAASPRTASDYRDGTDALAGTLDALIDEPM